MDRAAFCIAWSRPACAVALLSLVPFAASAQASDDEYDAATCMDEYNTDKVFRGDQSKTRENPFLDARIKADGFHGDTFGAGVPGEGHYGAGVSFDADTLIGFVSGEHSRLGAVVGVSLGGFSVPQHAYGFGGELRLGLARRRFSAAQFDWVSRLFSYLKWKPHACRFERTDLRLDFLRWRMTQVNDTSGAPGAFVSTISTIVASWGFVDVDGGFRLTVEPARVRLAPSVQWGPRIEVERMFGPLILGGAVGWYVGGPHSNAYALLSTGIHFEAGSGVGIQ